MSTSNFLNIKYQGINIPSQTTSVAATAGDIGYNSTTNKWAVWNTANDNLVTENTTQTLFNKTLDASTTNASQFTNGSGVFILNTTGTITVPNGTDTLVGTSLTQTLTNKTLAASSNTITGLTNSNLSGAAAISNTNLALMATGTIKGNSTGSSSVPSDLTGTQVNTILPVFTSSLNGLAPLSGGGTANFLRADGTWDAPPGATSGTVTNVSVVSANGFAGTVATATTTPAITLSTTVTGILQGNGTAISGLSTTGTGNVVLAGTPTITNLNAGSTQIINVADPTTAQMAATKNYVDMVASGLEPLQAVYAATIGSNIAGTYVNGVGGIGATFTTTSTATFTLDGTTPPLNSRILIKDQTSGFQNGVYNLTALPVTSVSGAVFTRALDYDTASDMNAGNLIPVLNGTVNAPAGNPTIWIQTATITTVGTDSLIFVKFNSGGSGSVTSVALTAPAIFTVSGSPVTSTGTLALSYSGTALPIANGGTGQVTAAAAYNALSPMTTAGDTEYEVSAGTAGRLPIGPAGYVMTSSGTAPQWSPVSTQGSVVASYYISPSTLTPGANNQINFDTKIVDTNNSVTTGTSWKFTAPIAGNYQLSGVVNYSSGTTGSVLVYKNAASYIDLGAIGIATGEAFEVAISQIISLNVGDFVDIRPNVSATLAGGSAPYFGILSIALQSGGVAPSTVGTVVASYYKSSSSSVPANTQINFDTKVIDTNSAVTTGSGWKFTAPVIGNYVISGAINTTTTGYAFYLYKNGSIFQIINDDQGGLVLNTYTITVPLSAGDLIDLRFSSTQSVVGAAGDFSTSISIMLANGGSNVSSGSLGSERIERAYITNPSGTAAISSQSGSWLTSATRTSTGHVTLVWPSGTWSAPPTVVVSQVVDLGGWAYITVAPTTTGVSIGTETPAGGGTNADGGFSIIVMGPR